VDYSSLGTRSLRLWVLVCLGNCHWGLIIPIKLVNISSELKLLSTWAHNEWKAAKMYEFIKCCPNYKLTNTIYPLPNDSILDRIGAHELEFFTQIFILLSASCRQLCLCDLLSHPTRYSFLCMKEHLCHSREFIWSYAPKNQFLNPKFLSLYLVLR
jgi:hypothetical protein